MIIIYHGRHAYLPIIACCLHLQADVNNLATLNTIQTLVLRRWQVEPLLNMGCDRKGNIICCLVVGPYGKIYERSLNGIAGIFNLKVQVIDVDRLFAQSLSARPMQLKARLAEWLPGLFGYGFCQMACNILKGPISYLQEDKA